MKTPDQKTIDQHGNSFDALGREAERELKDFQKKLELTEKVEDLDEKVFENIINSTEKYLDHLTKQNDVEAIDNQEMARINKEIDDDFNKRSASTGEYHEDKFLASAWAPTESDAMKYVKNIENLLNAAKEKNKRKVLVYLSILASHESNFDNYNYKFSRLKGKKEIMKNEFYYYASTLLRSPVPLSNRYISFLEYKPWVIGKPVSAADPSREKVDYGQPVD